MFKKLDNCVYLFKQQRVVYVNLTDNGDIYLSYVDGLSKMP